MADIKICSVNTIPNSDYEILGLVSGSVVQSKHIGRDLMAGLKTIVGGELEGYTEMLNEARSIATNRMIENAQKLGADCIIAVSYSTSSVMDGACEVLAYGTAIKMK